MTLDEAYDVLELDSNANDVWIKIQYRWLLKVYYPRGQPTADANFTRKVIEAYQTIKENRDAQTPFELWNLDL